MNENESGHRKWKSVEFASVTAVSVTLICLLVGQSAEQFAAQPLAPATQVAKARPGFNAIDYGVTGSTKGATIVIGPCDYKPR